MYVTGMHHVSSLTRDIIDNNDFYTKTLGLRRVKKTVNQNDKGMYHLFYADYKGTRGTDITFFEMMNVKQYQPGTNAISRTYFAVESIDALNFYKTYFKEHGIYHEGMNDYFGYKVLNFEDGEKHRMAIIVDAHNAHTEPNITEYIPEEYAIRRIKAVEVTVQYLKPFVDFLEMLGGKSVQDKDNDEHVEVKFNDDSIFVVEDRSSQHEKYGFGAVHHVALNVENEEALVKIIDLLDEEKWHHTGIVDRYYFKSIYIKAVNNITVEIATNGPGFQIDEPLESLGENFSLPPKLAQDRDIIEAYLRPIT